MNTTIRPIGLAIAVAAFAACIEGGPATRSTDTRTGITLPQSSRDAVLAEMRVLLTSLNGVLTGLARNDTALMREAAGRSGVAAAADPTLERVLPNEFMELGMDTHQQFDRLAGEIADGIPADSVVARLATLTDNCVACHEAYRLEVRR